jgi:hypothetical protein
MDLVEIGKGGEEWIVLAHDRYRKRGLVNAAIDERVP